MRISFIGLCFLFLVIAVLLTGITNIFGSVEQTTNMTGDEYESEYDAVTALVQIDMTLIVVIGFLLGFGGFLLLVYFLKP